MFRNAIVLKPSPSIKDGLSSSNLGVPDFFLASEQHSKYITTLQHLGLDVKILPGNDMFPDSTFIEDIALCTPKCAVIANPGALSRQMETVGIAKILKEFYKCIEEISSPGTLEAGDVMMVGNHYYIGISNRTNNEGAVQLIQILEKHGMSGSTVPLPKMLHLKSGVSYLENKNMLVSGELVHYKDFNGFNLIHIDDDESYAANSLWVNGTVIVPDGFPKTRKRIEKAGYKTIALDVSEFQKVDGGLSCLSLRF